MPAEQKEIHYLTGESAELLRHSPYLEAFREKGQDVLLLTDPIDEFAIPALREYKGKPLQAADRAEPATADGVPAEVKDKFAPLLATLKEKLRTMVPTSRPSRTRSTPSGRKACSPRPRRPVRPCVAWTPKTRTGRPTAPVGCGPSRSWPSRWAASR